MNKLTHLSLFSDRITSIKPLSSLTNLETLFLSGGNGIKDLNPLAGLTNLTSLSFTSDGITDVKLLAGLRNLTETIVMRKSIPDVVAQQFLKNFLVAFSSGFPLYRSVRQAREQLQGLEDRYPCALWLPVICQNPATI